MKLSDLKKLCDEATSGPVGARSEQGLRGLLWSVYQDPDRKGFAGAGNLPIASFIRQEDAREYIAARTYLPRLIAVAEAATLVLLAENSLSSDAIGLRDDLEKVLAALEAD